MSEKQKIFDWKGNEIKPGMTIYFVQTKCTHWGRYGLMIPSIGETIWESDEDYEKRKEEDDKPIWYLGRPYNVEERFGELYYITMPNEDGETFGCQLRYETNVTIAIKDISDKKP